MLTEDTLRSLSSPESYKHGKKLFDADAVYDTFKQGSLFGGKCEGSGAPYYEVRLRMDEGGILAASCNCPYDRGGFCKHIIALALACIHTSDAFVEQETVEELLQPLDKDALVRLIAGWVGDDPELHARLRTAIAETGLPSQSNPSQTQRKTQISRAEYRKQIRSILQSLRGYRRSEAYWMMGGIVKQLEGFQDTAYNFLNAGDAQSALVIMTTLLGEVNKNYGELDDSDGLIGGFCLNLALPMVEAVLSAELSKSERQKYYDELQPIVHELRDYGIENLDAVLMALNRSPAGEYLHELENYDSDERILTEASLNILERQNLVDDFLNLCLETGNYQRYVFKLIHLGEIEKAVETAEKTMSQDSNVLKIAEALRDSGHLPEAVRLAEKGLVLADDKAELGKWLGPIEEAQGRVEQAIQAYRAAFSSHPSLELYRTLEKLSGQGWVNLQPALWQEVQASGFTREQVDILLYEEDWDAAIAAAVGYRQDDLLEKVATAVLPQRPDWVIQISRSRAEELIQKTEKKFYKAAAKWLEKMKKAYKAVGKDVEWQAYLIGLKNTYARRPSLQSELKKL